ncbi:MAG TPA: TRAP transporter small permease [Burkholderiales bacterium]|jgi:TRAP-type C4-dicarboxylate transport system permease small subunit
MSSSETPPATPGGTDRVGLLGLTRSFIRLWAFGVGGFTLVGIVLMTAYSAASNFLIGQPIAGDFEIVQFGVGVAAFCFLPLAQLTRANIVVDIFTVRASDRTRAAMDLLGALVAVTVAVGLLWRMSIGLRDYYVHQEYTAIIGIPLWWAFPPILFSLFLLLIAALFSTAESFGVLRRTRPTGSVEHRE